MKESGPGYWSGHTGEDTDGREREEAHGTWIRRMVNEY